MHATLRFPRANTKLLIAVLHNKRLHFQKEQENRQKMETWQSFWGANNALS